MATWTSLAFSKFLVYDDLFFLFSARFKKNEKFLFYLEYETGKSAGKTLGFQPSGALSPFPVIVGAQSPQQKELDFTYSSVDEDEDGMPDDQQRRAPARAAAAEPAFFAQPVSGVSASASAVSTSGRVARKTRL